MFKFLYANKYPPKIKDKALIDKTYKYWRIRILYSMYLGYAFFYFTRKSLVFALPELIKNLHFSKMEIGILGSAFYITYGVSKFISGMLSDRSNPRYFLAIGLMMTGVANIIFGFSSSFPVLAAIWIANAFFQGWGWPPCARLLTHWYSQRERGVWWGIWNTSHNFGGALIPIIVGVVATYWGWRFAMFVPGIIAIAMSLIILNRLRDIPETLGLPPIEQYKNDYPQGHTIKQSIKTPMKEILFKYVLKNKYIWLLCFAYVTVYIVRTAFNDWGNLYLTSRGYSTMKADDCLSFFEIGGFLGSLVAGWMSDKIFAGRRGPVNLLFSIGIALAIIGFRIVPPGVHFVLHAACIFAIGFLVFGPQMLIGMAAAELSHREAAGTATGFAGLFGYLGAALSGFPIGFITQNWGWNGFFVAMLVCSGVTIILLSTMWSVRANPALTQTS